METIDPRHIDPRPRRPAAGRAPPAFAAAFKRVLWALDAGELETERLERSISAARELAPEASLTPAYVLDPEGLNWLGETPADRSEALRPAANAALEAAVRDAGPCAGRGRWVRPWIIELADVPVTGLGRKLARKLLGRARHVGADLILVQHRERTGLRRWLGTCFTERLINDGELPLLIVGPRAKRVERIGEFIFATDFSPGCRKAYERLLSLALALDVPVRIAHKLVPGSDLNVHSGALLMGGSWIHLPSLAEAMNDVRRQAGRDWTAHAETLGVRAEAVTDDSGDGLAASIARLCGAASDPVLVMTVPTGGSLPGSPWGSVTRDVLDEVPCPVLALRA